MVAYPDRGEGYDPEPFFFFFFFFFLGGWVVFHNQGSTFFTVGNMRVMICLGQGGLRSLSASSFFLIFIFFKSLLVACPTHTNPPGSGLGTGGIVFDKHIDKSTQQMN